jgi:pimeloyl-ACP methyl ester carboxylesterase
MHTIRTRFGKDIVAEFLPPARKTKKQRVVVIASGAPSSPSKSQLLEFLSKKGFWAINFRYRGSWESGGKFLNKSHDHDILDVITALPKGFVDLWTGRKYKLRPDQIIVLAGSFGGAAGILASRSKKIHKTVVVSPLIDWTRPGPDEPYPKMIRFFDQGYGPAFRIAKNGWKKLQSGKFFNPIRHTSEIDGSKLLIIHAKDDRTCPYGITKKFAKDTGAKLITLPRGDHLGSSIIMKPRFYKIFEKFVNAK